jgi:hypothetical protein
MKRCLHSRIAECKDQVNEVIEVLGERHFQRGEARVFFKAIDYHRAAVETTMPENQLVDLWAALEGFLPPPGEDTARITHYVNVLLPCLTLTYAEKLFRYVAAALQSGESKLEQLVQGTAPGGSFFEATVCLLVAEEHENRRQELFSLLAEHPLLRFRCFNLGEEFRTAERVHTTLKMHRERIAWHIQRIYSTRNQIVHHAYVDTLIKAIARVGVQANRPTSVAGAIKLLSVAEQMYLKDIKTSAERCSIENFRTIVFGSANPLSPCHDRFAISLAPSM